MPAKRAYSAYLSSMPADVPVVTANGSGAPQLQRKSYLRALLSPTRSASGLQPSALPAWLSLPARLATRYLRRQTIKAIPIISSTGSSKKRFIAAGVADEEYATPSPSVRARANQTRRENQRQARASQSWNGSLGPRQFRDSPIRHTSPANTQDYGLERLHPQAATPTTRTHPSSPNLATLKTANTSLDVNTGSPINVSWDSPQIDSPASPTPSPQSHDYAYESPACDNPGSGMALFSVSCCTYLSAYYTISARISEAATPSSSRNHHSVLSNCPPLHPVRRQLLKLQLGNDTKRRRAAPLTKSAKQGFAETQSPQTNPEAAN
ncbi:unnamed protein product [Alternaria alternata]